MIYVVARDFADYERFCRVTGLITAKSQMIEQDLNQSALVGDTEYVSKAERLHGLDKPRVIITALAVHRKDYKEIVNTIASRIGSVVTHANI